MRLQFSTACLLLACSGSVASAPDAQHDAPLYLALKSAGSGPARLLNDSPRIHLAGLDELGQPRYYELHSIQAATAVGAIDLWTDGSLGVRVEGDGMEAIGLWDSAKPLLTHEALEGRIQLVDTSQQTSSHATHVAGLMIGDSPRDDVSGMAPSATIDFRDWESDNQEMLNAAHGGMLVSNQSYGSALGWTREGVQWFWHGNLALSTTEDARFGYYDQTSQFVDEICWFKPWFLPVQSAGNHRLDGGPGPGVEYWVFQDGVWTSSLEPRDRDGGVEGFDTLGPRAVTKNGLVVGSCLSLSSPYQQPSDVQMTEFSSFGPTDDGRIKPDLVAPGSSNLSSWTGGNDVYQLAGGTSTSAPIVAACALLLQQLRGQGQGDPEAGPARLSSAALKALLIHSAREAGDAPGPDYRFGWGLLNVSGAAALLNQSNQTGLGLLEHGLDPGETIILPMRTVSPRGKATLCWTDPPIVSAPLSLDDPTPRMVNDLDLVLLSSGGAHLAWSLDPANPGAPAQAVGNHLDNVEVVELSGGIDDRLHLLIQSSELLDDRQDFALAWEGLVPVACLQPSVQAGELLPGDTLEIEIQLDGAIEFSGIDLRMSWPTQALQILEVEAGSLLMSEAGDPTLGFNVYSLNKAQVQGMRHPDAGRLRIASGTLLRVRCLLQTATSCAIELDGSFLASKVPNHELDTPSLVLGLQNAPPDLEFDPQDLNQLSSPNPPGEVHPAVPQAGL